MPPLTEEQEKAILSIDEHVLVSAGAGSGKTFVLVERYIKVLESDAEAGVNDIIAVTYTKKAAEEMRSRLKLRLKQLHEECTDAVQRQRWLECLADVEYARIGTIHSLCESMLKSYPSEAGIDPAFEILGDLDRAELLAESIDEVLHTLIEKPMDNFIDLLDFPIESVRGWIARFLYSPLKYKEARKRFGDNSISSIRSFAKEFIDEGIKRALRELSQNKQLNFEVNYLRDSDVDPESKLGLLRREMLHLLNIVLAPGAHGAPLRGQDDRASGAQGAPLPGPDDREPGAHGAPLPIVEESRTDLDNADLVGARLARPSITEQWQALVELAALPSAGNNGGASAKELRESIRNIRKEIQAVAKSCKHEFNEADERAFVLIRALIMLSDEALAKYEFIKQQHQKLDFDDLIERCQHLVLAENSHALKQLSRRLKAVLVDEFQDTNWTQAKLLTALAGGKAKLFLIGDDKQSIYKFQGADVGTFNACKSYISSLLCSPGQPSHDETAASYGLRNLHGTGQLMTLSQSFRSHPQIVNFVNHLFRRLFNSTNSEDDYKSRFQALRPARERLDADGIRVEIIYTPPLEEESLNPRAEIEAAEAKQTAAWIKAMVSNGTEIFDKSAGKSRPINYADFAVLLQANGDFAGIERALAEESIPYVSIAGSGFLDRQEVYDLENMLKWLSCPQDSHALFAVLRSPFFGFSDDILHELKAGKNTSLWQCLSQMSQEEGQEELRSARRSLQELQRASGTMALPEIVRKIIFTTAYDVALLCTPSGKQKSRNVWKFLSLCSQYRHMSISEFLLSLKSMRDLGVKNLTDAPLCADNAVKIMTIHKSKGLEFAAVALPRLSRSVHSMTDKLLFAKDFGIAFDCSRDSEEEKSAFFTAANNLSRKMDEEEKKRLLYVATTRARDFLAMFITPRCKRNTNFGKWLMESLTLPDPDGTVEENVVDVGSGEERCSWKISQPLVVNEDSSEAGNEMPFAEASETSARSESEESLPEFFEASEKGAVPEFVLLDRLLEAGGTAALQSPQNADLSLLDFIDENSLANTFAPVPWQQLLRVCPTEETATVHATIQGNYFHLLMGKLGENLELPSEEERKALLYHHEVGVHDQAQQEFLLKQSEQLLITFKNSGLHSLLKSCRRRFNEYSYMIVRGDHEEEFRPDLIIEDAAGQWHVVDYKTDQFEQKHMAKHLSQHHEQLSTYVEDLETLLSIKAKAWVYFAHYGRLEPINI